MARRVRLRPPEGGGQALVEASRGRPWRLELLLAATKRGGGIAGRWALEGAGRCRAPAEGDERRGSSLEGNEAAREEALEVATIEYALLLVAAGKLLLAAGAPAASEIEASSMTRGRRPPGMRRRCASRGAPAPAPVVAVRGGEGIGRRGELLSLSRCARGESGGGRRNEEEGSRGDEDRGLGCGRARVRRVWASRSKWTGLVWRPKWPAGPLSLNSHSSFIYQNSK